MTRYIQSKKFSKTKQSRGLVLLSMLITFSVLCLGFLYLIQTNALVGHIYQIKEHKQKIAELKSQGKDLEMNIAQWRSPVNLEEVVESLGMVETSRVIYLESEKAMAVKK